MITGHRMGSLIFSLVEVEKNDEQHVFLLYIGLEKPRRGRQEVHSNHAFQLPSSFRQHCYLEGGSLSECSPVVGLLLSRASKEWIILVSLVAAACNPPLSCHFCFHSHPVYPTPSYLVVRWDGTAENSDLHFLATNLVFPKAGF